MAAKIARWVTVVAVGLVLLLGAIVLVVDTSAGHRLLADRLAAYETESGLNIRVGRIDGSVYGRMTLRDVTVRDPTGVFLTAPAMLVDWRPFAYAHGLIDVRVVDADTVRLLRLPALKPVASDPDAPTLPDIDLALGKLHVGHLIVDPPVTGRRHVVRLDGSAEIADGRARIFADGAALPRGGDRRRRPADDPASTRCPTPTGC